MYTNMDWSTVDVHYLSEAFWGARNFDMKETKQMAPLYVHIWGKLGNFEWLIGEIKKERWKMKWNWWDLKPGLPDEISDC